MNGAIDSLWFVTAVFLVLVCLNVLIISIVLSHGAWLDTAGRRRRERAEQARKLLARKLSEPTDLALTIEERQSLERLSDDALADTFLDLARNTEGSSRARLREYARQAGVAARADRLMRSRRWHKRLKGVRLAALLGGSSRRPLELLEDKRVEVRAAAAEWVAEHPSAEGIDRLVRLLGDPAGLCRFTVQDSLIRIGDASTDVIVDRTVQNYDVLTVQSALIVASKLRSQRFSTLAYAASHRENPVVRTSAIALVAALGGGDAIARLRFALQDSEPDVRAAALRGLGRLRDHESIGSIAAALRDPSFAVRREAGFALLELGAEGELQLHRFREDQDRYASDMARQMLDLPAAVREAGRW